MTRDELNDLWDEIHAVQALIDTYETGYREADDDVRAALAHGTYDQILAAYDIRMERHICDEPRVKPLREQRSQLFKRLPKRQQ